MIITVYPKQLHDNPYQVRLARDPVKFAELKASINEHGVLEKPIVRKDPKDPTVFQIAFGHGRRDAWEEVRPKLPMEVDLRLLTDQQMFDYSWDENHEREDLSPIEEALLLQKEAIEFHLTQKQLAERHKKIKDQGSISNKLALLHLPDPVRMMVHSRQLSERNARQLIPFAKISPKDVEKTAKEIAHFDPDDAFQWETPEEKIDELYDKHAERIPIYSFKLSWPKKPIAVDPKILIKGAPATITQCTGCNFLRTRDGTTWCFRPACLQQKKNLHVAAERKAHPIKQEQAKPAAKPKKEKPDPKILYEAEAERLIAAAVPSIAKAIPHHLVEFLLGTLMWYERNQKKNKNYFEKQKAIVENILDELVPHARFEVKKPTETIKRIQAIARSVRIQLPKGWSAIPAGEPKKSKKIIFKSGLGSYTTNREAIVRHANKILGKKGKAKK